jgi:hypothetical protein
MAYFMQRLQGMQGPQIHGAQAVIDAIETGSDPLILTQAQKNTIFTVLDRWADDEDDDSLGSELVELRDAIAEDIAEGS